MAVGDTITLSMSQPPAPGLSGSDPMEASDFVPSGSRELTIPRQLGPVKLNRELGRGGMGVVWLGRHELLGRDVAVKFMLNAVEANDPGFKLFLSGARAAGAVRHLGLTNILHADLIERVPYLVMEFVSGPSLADVLDREKSLSCEAAIAAMKQVIDAVAELHDRSIVHRDIKPSNVLLDADGHTYVSDFGLACSRSQDDSLIVGTPAYMAPEMFHGQPSPRSDVYALGVTLYELLVGERPHEPFAQKHCPRSMDDLGRDRLVAKRADSPLVELIERCVNKDPIYRFKTGRHLQRALAEATGKLGDDRTILVRLVSRATSAEHDSPESITPGAGGANYFDTIAALARKRESGRSPASAPPSLDDLAAATRSSAVTPPPLPGAPVQPIVAGKPLAEPSPRQHQRGIARFLRLFRRTKPLDEV